MPKFFPITRTKKVVEFVGSGDTDVDFIDSVAISDQLSGTLGPVNAQDSIDISDKPIVGPFNAKDSIDQADKMSAITGLKANDSVDISDRLAGTLGPVNALDSVDLADVFKGGSFKADDSISISDAPFRPVITANNPDSLSISDAMSPIIEAVHDSIQISDEITSRIVVVESVDVADALKLGSLKANDSIDISDAQAPASLVALVTDSTDLADVLTTIVAKFAESVDMGDNRSPVTFSGVLWPNATVSNTGWTTPANMIDVSTSTASTCAATSSGLAGTGGTQNTTANDMIVSCGNPVLSDWVINGVTLDWVITAAQSGLPLSAGQCNINYQYSLNDGASWTTFFAQTALVNSTGSLSLGGSTQVNYAYTGSEVPFTVPSGVTSLTVDMAGAQGGTANGQPFYKGGRLQATLTVTPGETIRLGVGGQGQTVVATTGKGAGGFYAGAPGGDGGSWGGPGGGGQSYIKRGGTADSNRVLVAGGAGGTTANPVNASTNVDGGKTLHTEATAASAATAGTTATGVNYAGAGGGGGWVGGTGGATDQNGTGGSNMAHSTQTSGVTSTAGFQSGNGYISLTYAGSAATEVNYAYTGGDQSFTVPAGISSLALVLNGAGGGDDGSAGATLPFRGSRLTCTLAVAPGDTILIKVGGKGQNASGLTKGLGGWPNGGDGFDGTTQYGGGGGGGSTEVYKNGVLVAVAAAAGGVNSNTNSDDTSNGTATLQTQATGYSPNGEDATAQQLGYGLAGGGGGYVGGAKSNGTTVSGYGGTNMYHTTHVTSPVATGGIPAPNVGDGSAKITYGGSGGAGSVSQTQLQQLRFRAVGNVLSGTGLLPVTTTASWFFTRATITASKTY